MSLPKINRPKRGGIYQTIDGWLPAGKKARFLLKYMAVPLISLLLVYILFNYIVMPIVTRHGSEFALPDISDRQEEAAKIVLEKAGLGMEVVTREYRAGKPEGLVISQYPPAGTKVKSGRIIKVTLSSGTKLVKIPALAGFSMRQAKLNIEASGLVLGEVAWTFSDSLPENVVVFSYPSSGTEIPIGSAVNLMVNRGSLTGTVTMPLLVGKTLDEAKELLQSTGLKLGEIKYIHDNNYLPETILEQSVDDSTQLEAGEAVDLTVSTVD